MRIEEASYGRIYQHTRDNGTFAIIGSEDKDTHKSRYDELKSLIKEYEKKYRHLGYNRLSGTYQYQLTGEKVSEKSVIIYNIELKDALSIAKKINQESIIWKENTFFGIIDVKGSVLERFKKSALNFSKAIKNGIGSKLMSDQTRDFGYAFEEVKLMRKNNLSESILINLRESKEEIEEVKKELGLNESVKDKNGDFILYRRTSSGPLYISGMSTTFDKEKAIKFPTEEEAKEYLHEYIENVVDPEGTDFIIGRLNELNEGVETKAGNDFDEVASYMYNEANGDIDYIPSFEQTNDYIASVTKKEYNALYKAVENAIGNVADHMYNGSIELSDRSTINRLTGDYLDEYDPDVTLQVYQDLCNDAFKEFEEETGVEAWLDGRMGRHVVVANNYENARDYDTLCNTQEKWEDWVVEEFAKAHSKKPEEE